MFGLFKKKPIDAGRLEFLSIACISSQLRQNENATSSEMAEAVKLWLKKGGYELSSEQNFAIQAASLNISSSSEAKKALKNMYLEDDLNGAKLHALRAILAKNKIFLFVA
jgi:hypothetical protein